MAGYEVNPQLPEATLKELMAQFDRVSKDTLDDPVCPCCLVEYAFEGEEAEYPVKTPCNHIFGHLCLEQWLPNNSCPLCRQKLFDQVAVGDDIISSLHRIQDRRRLNLMEFQRFLQDSRHERPEATSAEEHTDRDLGLIVEHWGPWDIQILVLNALSAEAENRWIRLYRELYDEGASLAEHPGNASEVERRIAMSGGYLWIFQLVTLVQELQQRGAFDYPGMPRFYRFLPDLLLFWKLRQSGLCWGTDHTWMTSDGTVVWSRAGNGTNQTGSHLEDASDMDAETELE